jgi:hypothetical protein
LGFSFYQHYHTPLGGDIADVINPTPSKGYYKVLHDPVGLNVLLNQEKYPNPNRFFAHWFTSEYFLNFPLFLQKFVNPIQSIYLASAIAKLLTQILIIYLLAVYISGTKNLLKLNFIIAAILITPLFQTSGYNRYMGIIDQSVIYTFFYALPIGLLLLFYLPFFERMFYDKKPEFKTATKILLVILMVILTFNGPLIPGVVLIICPMVLINTWINNYKSSKISSPHKRIAFAINKTPKTLMFFFIGFCLLSLYSLYIGQYNNMNFNNSIPLFERYLRLPSGLIHVFTQKIGFPLLFVAITFNTIIINKYYSTIESDKIMRLAKWVGVFSIIYLLLLPFGGYRSYRENIIRYDTLMPVTLGIMFVFGKTTFYLIKNISIKRRPVYILSIVLILLIFTNSDRPDTSAFYCEQQALLKISQSKENIVELYEDCPVMEWVKLDDYKKSDRNAILLNYWNITDKKRLYYHKTP